MSVICNEWVELLFSAEACALRLGAYALGRSTQLNAQVLRCGSRCNVACHRNPEHSAQSK
jgi:hypothetical protein